MPANLDFPYCKYLIPKRFNVNSPLKNTRERPFSVRISTYRRQDFLQTECFTQD